MKRLVGIIPRNKATTDGKQSPSKAVAKSSHGLDDIVQMTDRKVGGMEFQITECDNQLRKISQQMKNLPAGVSRQSLQAKAKGILLRKKRYEQQAEQLREKSFNMESLASTISNAEDMTIVAGVMKSGTKSMKKQLEKIDLDQLDNFQDELADLIELTEDVQEAMSKNFSVPLDIDDIELNEQLELLGDEIVQDNDTSYIDAALKPPTNGLSTEMPGSSGGVHNNALKVDEFGLPILNNYLRNEVENSTGVNQSPCSNTLLNEKQLQK